MLLSLRYVAKCDGIIFKTIEKVFRCYLQNFRFIRFLHMTLYSNMSSINKYLECRLCNAPFQPMHLKTVVFEECLWYHTLTPSFLYGCYIGNFRVAGKSFTRVWAVGHRHWQIIQVLPFQWKYQCLSGCVLKQYCM